MKPRIVKTYPFLASILAACTLSSADAQITYVDADTRPFANHGYDRSVVWFRGNYHSYTSFNTEVVGIFQNHLKILDFTMDIDGGSVEFHWASEPGKAYRIMASEDLQNFPHEATTAIDSQGASTSKIFTIPNELMGGAKVFFRVEEQSQ